MSTIKEIITELTEKSKLLREEVPNLLTQTSPEVIQDEQIKRDELKNECQRVHNHVKDQIADLEAILRKIREIKSDLSHDNKKLDSVKWDRINTRKLTNA